MSHDGDGIFKAGDHRLIFNERIVAVTNRREFIHPGRRQIDVAELEKAKDPLLGTSLADKLVKALLQPSPLPNYRTPVDSKPIYTDHRPRRTRDTVEENRTS